MQRPTSALVFGILNIVFGVLDVCGLWASLSGLFGVSPPDNPVVAIIDESAFYQAYMIVSSVLSFLAIILLIATGIGLINMKPWARTGSIIYGIYAIVRSVIGVIVTVVFLFGPLQQQAESGSPEAAGALGGFLVVTIVAGCIGLVYPIVLLVFMMKPTFAPLRMA